MVVENATRRLAHRDYVLEFGLRTRNHTTGNRSAVPYARVSYENSADRLHARIWPNRFRDDRPMETGPPRRVWVHRDGPGWISPPGESGWHPSSDPLFHERRPDDPLTNYVIDRGNLTVRTDNATHYVVVGRDPGRTVDRDLEAFRLTVVVAKRPDPHLVSATATREFPRAITHERFAVVQYRNATAPRPKRVPSTTIEEIVGRAAAGIDRLF